MATLNSKLLYSIVVKTTTMAYLEQTLDTIACAKHTMRIVILGASRHNGVSRHISI